MHIVQAGIKRTEENKEKFLTFRTSCRVELFRWLLLLLTNILSSRYSTDFSPDDDSVSTSWEEKAIYNTLKQSNTF